DMRKEQLLWLLIIDDASNESENIIQALRSVGYVVKSLRLKSNTELQSALSQSSWDILLLNTGNDTKQAEAILTAVNDSHIPVLLFGKTGSNEDAISLLAAGARDTINSQSDKHILHVIKRELSDLKLRREYQLEKQRFGELEQRYLELIEGSRDGIAYIHDGMHIQSNSAYAKLLGYKNKGELEGAPLLDLITEQDQSIIRNLLYSFAKGEAIPATLNVHTHKSTNSDTPICMELSSAYHDDEQCIRITIRENSTNKELENKLRQIKNQDQLTSLFNRQYFIQRLEEIKANVRQGRSGYALFYIDIDRFQDIKKKFGIAASDSLLVDIADLLRKNLGVETFPTRYDGNIFTALVRHESNSKTLSRANSLCRDIEEHITDIDGQSASTTASIGIGLITANTPDAKDILDRAFKACATAKSSGGNKSSIYVPMDDELADKERLNQWTQKIRQAIHDERFHLSFQPIVSLHGHPGEKYEALLRMNNEQGNEIPLGQFFPAAEKAGLMSNLDRWVIQHALHNLALHRNRGKDASMFIKLSPITMKDPSLLPWIKSQLDLHLLDAQHVTFEISEADALSHIKLIKTFLEGLKQLGCGLALDHFGLTPNAIALQKHLQAEYLKIDGSLINKMATDEAIIEKVKNITQMANKTNAQTIAQFVEDANCLALLWQTGVNYIQGYFVQGPDAAMRYDFSESA
ncbi:MAG: EAL domain-containing protein, partial [Gammaproteobacteria bacterium]|nr:EAL domain-containing protein [Gammaproteobacteria bacterium]